MEILSIEASELKLFSNGGLLLLPCDELASEKNDATPSRQTVCLILRGPLHLRTDGSVCFVHPFFSLFFRQISLSQK